MNTLHGLTAEKAKEVAQNKSKSQLSVNHTKDLATKKVGQRWTGKGRTVEREIVSMTKNKIKCKSYYSSGRTRMREYPVDSHKFFYLVSK